MRHAGSMPFVSGILFLLLCTVGVAQNTTTPAYRPAPDFSTLPDPTNQRRIQYQPFDNTLLTFSTSAQYVLVPVVVTDKAGHPVPGLTKEAFRIQENGRDQKIASLEEFAPGSPVSVVGTNIRSTTNSGAAKQLVIIVFDMVNTPVSDQQRARLQLISYLANGLEPDGLYELAAVENNGVHILHEYTQDPAQLIASLKAVKNKFPTTNMVDTAMLRGDIGTISSPQDPSTPAATHILEQFIHAEELYVQTRLADAASSTLLAFQQIAQHVSKVPGRKSLVWVTGGFPFSIDPSSASVNQGLSFLEYQRTMHVLSNQMIAVYSVDARGVLTLGPDAAAHLTTKEVVIPNEFLNRDADRQRDILDTMRTFSDMTGGRAFVNTNDTRGAIREAVRDGSAYYLLSYPVDKSNRHQGWRKITVKVGSYHVRARRGYFLTKATADAINL